MHKILASHKNLIQMIHRDKFLLTEEAAHEARRETFDWQISTDRQEILGYMCRKPTANSEVVSMRLGLLWICHFLSGLGNSEACRG